MPVARPAPQKITRTLDRNDSGGFGVDDVDDRSPVTISLPEYGNRTVPNAFGTWLDDDGLTGEFDKFICHHRESKAAGDVLEEFVRDRDDAPANVLEAVTGYSDYMDDYFGPPV